MKLNARRLESVADPTPMKVISDYLTHEETQLKFKKTKKKKKVRQTDGYDF